MPLRPAYRWRSTRKRSDDQNEQDPAERGAWVAENPARVLLQARRSKVRAAESHRDFSRSPWGRYVVGRTWLVFAADPWLSGLVLWGTGDLSDASACVRVLPHAGQPMA